MVKRATVKLNAQQKGLSSPNEAKIFSKAATCIFQGKKRQVSSVQGSDVGTKTHFNRDDLNPSRTFPRLPDQCRVDLSRNLRSMSNGKNSALGIDAVVNGRAANSFNSEKLMHWKHETDRVVSMQK